MATQQCKCGFRGDRARVCSCTPREVQPKRLQGAAIYCNAQMGAREVREHCRRDEWCARLLEGAMRALGLSARGYARVLKVVRTIADVAGERRIGLADVAEAIQCRERPRAMD